MEINILPLEQCLYQGLFNDQSMKIGHVRADHNGCRWWTSWWSANDDLKTSAITSEIDCVCSHLLEVLLKNGLLDIQALCAEYPQTVVGDPQEGENNFFVDGDECGYWVRLINRPRDYNLYLHCFIKQTKNGGISHEH